MSADAERVAGGEFTKEEYLALNRRVEALQREVAEFFADALGDAFRDVHGDLRLPLFVWFGSSPDPLTFGATAWDTNPALTSVSPGHTRSPLAYLVVDVERLTPPRGQLHPSSGRIPSNPAQGRGSLRPDRSRSSASRLRWLSGPQTRVLRALLGRARTSTSDISPSVVAPAAGGPAKNLPAAGGSSSFGKDEA